MRDTKTTEEARLASETYHRLQDEVWKGSNVRNLGYGNKKDYFRGVKYVTEDDLKSLDRG